MTQRQLMDYVTCGTGSYFNHTGIIPNVFYADKLGAPHAEALKQVVKHAQVQCEAHIRTPENAEEVLQIRARPTWCRSCAGRLPIRIGWRRRGTGGLKMCGPACPAIRCAGAGAIATTGFPA